MGEAQEQKKPNHEEKKIEEKKKPDKPEEAKTEENNSNQAPPPPQEIILGVYMHCEGCAKKIRRCLKGFMGVENVQTDCKTHKVIINGEKADPLKILERVQQMRHRQVDLLSPIPNPRRPPAPVVEPPEKKKDPTITEEPKVITVILKVHMHCEVCAQEIKRRIFKMKGVMKIDADLKSSQVTFNGTFDPPKLLEYIYKRTGKHVVIVKQEEVEKTKEEIKGDGGEKAAPEKEVATEAAAALEKVVAVVTAEEGGIEVEKGAEVKKNEVYYHYNQPMNFQMYPPTRLGMDMYVGQQSYGCYAPQMFSDENPNACRVM
ncbi:heavy metal-associated isoprenylated plant protein 7-like [Impatiens glandulifera]|uniref:heavy metal-associated isoprenylated plant protein 7-like n=1 Tax=Impatiens glandulifera TaxID=253017 RepID=UPI001FB0BACA|nr:heavy metal-associated isoprenylated plant protein 7-like [Impatiens glandulifera]